MTIAQQRLTRVNPVTLLLDRSIDRTSEYNFLPLPPSSSSLLLLLLDREEESAFVPRRRNDGRNKSRRRRIARDKSRWIAYEMDRCATLQGGQALFNRRLYERKLFIPLHPTRYASRLSMIKYDCIYSG